MNDYKNILRSQLEMNQMTWKELNENGLAHDDLVRLDFFYVCTNQENAKALKEFLDEETDYDILIEPSEKDTWNVNGSTQKTMVTLEILNQWVERMVIAGAEHNCVFDGWGTSV